MDHIERFMTLNFEDHPQVRVATDFDTWVNLRYEGEVNALCFKREVEGDYQEILNAVETKSGVVTLEMDWLQSLKLSPKGHLARLQILEDFQRLTVFGANPQLDAIFQSYEDEVSPVFPTHVHSWHVDRAPIEAETYLCTYIGEVSEGVSEKECVAKIHLPKYRSALLQHFGGQDDEGFEEILNQESYDLHFEVLPDADIYQFGIGNLWRVTVLSPDASSPPCVHRAPFTSLGDQPRLLMIG